MRSLFRPSSLLRWLLPALALTLFAADATAGIRDRIHERREERKAARAGGCTAPSVANAGYSPAPTPHITPKGDSVGYSAPLTGSACASGACSATAAKRGFFRR